jgi:CubicO group peptidase (beta-lactamase class C family)
MKKSISPSLSPGPFGRGGKIEGTVEPGWESVQSAFEDNFAANMELGAQLVVYHQNQVVVDIFGKSDSQEIYDSNSLQNVYSSGKNMEAVCIALLADRGLLSYTDQISMHWPEFGQHGKSQVTVADVLRHEGGVPFFASVSEPGNFKKDYKLTESDISSQSAIEKVIESSVMWNLDSKRHYHAITRGWILSAVIRRVDPKGRSLGQFMAEEICSPHGLKIYCGMSKSEQNKHNFANVKLMPEKYALPFVVLPAKLGVGDPTIRGMLEMVFGKESVLKRHSEYITTTPIASLHYINVCYNFQIVHILPRRILSL